MVSPRGTFPPRHLRCHEDGAGTVSPRRHRAQGGGCRSRVGPGAAGTRRVTPRHPPWRAPVQLPPPRRCQAQLEHSWLPAGGELVPPGAAGVVALRGHESPTSPGCHPATGGSSRRRAAAPPSPAPMGACSPRGGPESPRVSPRVGTAGTPCPHRWRNPGEAGCSQAVAFPRPRWPRVKALPPRSRQCHLSPTCPQHPAGAGRGPRQPPAQSGHPPGVSREGTCHRPAPRWPRASPDPRGQEGGGTRGGRWDTGGGSPAPPLGSGRTQHPQTPLCRVCPPPHQDPSPGSPGGPHPGDTPRASPGIFPPPRLAKTRCQRGIPGGS